MRLLSTNIFLNIKKVGAFHLPTNMSQLIPQSDVTQPQRYHQNSQC